MNRLYPILPTLIALLAAGCIENPGVDPEVGRSDTVERASIEARFRQGNFLQLRLTRDSGRISLSIANTGLGTIDSSAFLLRISGSHMGFTSSFHDPHPHLEFYGKTAGLAPGASSDFGVIDSLLPFRLSEGRLQAWVIRAAEDGRRTGSAFGGVFTGRHRGVDTGGKVFEGPLRGIITADGAIQLSIFRAGYESALGDLEGSVSDSGTMASTFSLSYQNRGKAGRVFPKESGFGGAFTFEDAAGAPGRRWIDSLALEYQPYSPR